MDINSRPVHSQLCESLAVEKKCYNCYRSCRNAWQNKSRARERYKKAALLKTRSTTKVKTIYKNVLCKNCEDKTPKYLCEDCKTKYQSAKNKKYRHNVRQKAAAAKLLEKPINDLGLVQTTNTSRVITKKGKPMKEKSNQMQTSNEIKSELKKLKGNCKQNNHTNLPSMAKNSSVNVKNDKTSAKRKRGHESSSSKKKQKSLNKSDQINVRPAKILSPKTLANTNCEAHKLFGYSPRRREQKIKSFLESIPRDELKTAMKELFPKFNIEMGCNLHNKNKKMYGSKSNETYKHLTNIVDELDIKNPTEIIKHFGTDRPKANELFYTKETSRKIRTKKITSVNVSKIQDFYKRGDISILSPKYREASQKKGASRHMRFSIREAYKIFRRENPDVQIGHTSFWKLRPGNMKPLRNTPLLGCLCVYCTNVKIKLIELNIADIKNEYDLYNRLICKKEENQEYRNSSCIFNTCKTCSDWDKTIKSLVSTKLDDLITWTTWGNVVSKTKKDKESKNKKPIKHQGTVADCRKELIEVDIMKKKSKCKNKSKKNNDKESKYGFTFVKHFFSQSYQYQQFAKCKSTLKPGQALCLQDFSNSIDCTPQDETKAGRYGGPLMVTSHPTVIYPKVSEETTPKEEKIVITHLSANNKQDAHMVYYITKDCIEYLVKNFPETTWTKIYIWSDGCTQQYKSKTSFYYLKKFDIEVERNFFATEHGKNESDGITGEISRKVHDVIKSRNIIFYNARDVQIYLSKEMPKYVFRFITNEDLKPIYNAFKNVNLKVLTGNCTRSLHQIKPGEAEGEYLVRQFSCFCLKCKEGIFKSCKNKEYTRGVFKSQTLPLNGSNTHMLPLNSSSSHKNKKSKIEDETESEGEYDGQDEGLEDYSDGSENEEELEEELEEEEVEEDPIEISQQIIEFEELEGQYIVGSNSCGGHFVAKIETKKTDSITVNILKQDTAAKDIFKDSTDPQNKCRTIPINNVIMILPWPTLIQSGGKYRNYMQYLCQGPINLN